MGSAFLSDVFESKFVDALAVTCLDVAIVQGAD